MADRHGLLAIGLSHNGRRVDDLQTDASGRLLVAGINPESLPIVLRSSAPLGVGGSPETSAAVSGFHWARELFFLLRVTGATAGDGTETLDVYVQTMINNVWTSIGHFSQLGPWTAAVNRVARIVSGIMPTDVESPVLGASAADIPAGVWKQGPFGSQLRVVSVVAGGGNPSYTFDVSVVPK